MILFFNLLTYLICKTLVFLPPIYIGKICYVKMTEANKKIVPIDAFWFICSRDKEMSHTAYKNEIKFLHLDPVLLRGLAFVSDAKLLSQRLNLNLTSACSYPCYKKQMFQQILYSTKLTSVLNVFI